MGNTDGRRAGRRPRGTTRQSDVVNAALAVADQVGIERLTIRAVARVAKVPTMSLYSHFSSKAQLLDLMNGEVMLRLFVDEPHATWQAGVLSTCDRIREVLLTHPRWVPLLSRPAPPVAVPWRERILGLMIADGFSPEAAFMAISSAVLVAEGLMLLELTLTDPDGKSNIMEDVARLKTWAHEAPSTGHPTTRAALLALPHFDLAENFAVAVRTYVAGLETAQRPSA
jgi:AcrR family transcriptional regulator